MRMCSVCGQDYRTLERYGKWCGYSDNPLCPQMERYKRILAEEFAIHDASPKSIRALERGREDPHYTDTIIQSKRRRR